MSFGNLYRFKIFIIYIKQEMHIFRGEIYRHNLSYTGIGKCKKWNGGGEGGNWREQV